MKSIKIRKYHQTNKQLIYEQNRDCQGQPLQITCKLRQAIFLNCHFPSQASLIQLISLKLLFFYVSKLT